MGWYNTEKPWQTLGEAMFDRSLYSDLIELQRRMAKYSPTPEIAAMQQEGMSLKNRAATPYEGITGTPVLTAPGLLAYFSDWTHEPFTEGYPAYAEGLRRAAEADGHFSPDMRQTGGMPAINRNRKADKRRDK